MSRRLLIAAPTDFSKESIGGTSAIIEEVLSVVDDSVIAPVLVGATEGKSPIGQWGKVEVAGKSYPFFPVSRHIKSGVMPARIALSIGLFRFGRALAMRATDVAYAHCPEAALSMKALAPSTPTILHVHGTASPLSYSRFRAARNPVIQAIYQATIMRATLRSVSGVFVTSDERAFQEFCLKWGETVAKKARRVPAMVNTDVFAPAADRAAARERLGFTGGEPIVVSVGRIERTKGAGDAFAAFRRLRESGVQAKYAIVGDGSYRATLEQLVESFDWKDDVIFTGALPREQVAKVLGAADVFMSGSWQEGFSVALLEALACGLPAVATDVGGVREVVDDGVNGYVVQSGDVEALGTALAAAVMSRSTLGTSSRARAMAYGTKRIADAVVADVLACSASADTGT